MLVPHSFSVLEIITIFSNIYYGKLVLPAAARVVLVFTNTNPY
jgi:hypothetical protein